MYKNRWHMVLKGLLFGSENPEEVKRLSENYQNWTPLEVHVYQTGVFGGFLGGMVFMAILVIIELALTGKI